MRRFKHPPMDRLETLVSLSHGQRTGIVRGPRLMNAADRDPEDDHQALAGSLDPMHAEMVTHCESGEGLFMGLTSDEDGA